MSIHPSLHHKKIKRRSVLKRFERLQKAMKEGKWKEGMSVFGLPKYNFVKVKSIKKKTEETTTTLGKTDILEQHKLIKERMAKDKKLNKIKKETTGRK